MDECDKTVPYLKQKDDISEELKHEQLSVIVLVGTPNLVIILSSRKSMTTTSVSFLVVIASTHLVK